MRTLDVELSQRAIDESVTNSPPYVARYRAVLWEPVASTGECVVALLSVEPKPECADDLAPGTFPVIRPERLRAIFGRQRGDGALGVMAECARYMTQRQLAGERLEALKPLFAGFSLAPIYQARGYSVSQLLDTAVRSVSAVASADEMLLEFEPVRSTQTRRTADFLRQLRRDFAAGDDDRARRFNVCLQREQNAPEVWIDYASGPVIVQAASVPSSIQQLPPAEAELKSKMLDLEVVRREFGSNPIKPTILLNVHALQEPRDAESLRIARTGYEQFRRYADWAKLKVVEVTTASAASSVLERL